MVWGNVTDDEGIIEGHVGRNPKNRLQMHVFERYGGDKILKGTTFTKYKQFVENAFKILPRQALHAKTLGFVHPVTGAQLQFDSELPEDMAQCIEKWRSYAENSM